MKKQARILFFIFSILLIFTGCEPEDPDVGDLLSPTNIEITAIVVGQDDANPNGDGSGVVNFTAQADNAISYRFIYGSNEQTSSNGKASYIFSNLGVNTYTLNVLAYGTGGASTTETITVEVLATYSPPQDLLDKLYGDGSRTWRIKSEKTAHFGLGPVGGNIPTEFFAVQPEEKVGVGMYDDRYIFSEDGTFTFITNTNNDEDGTDTSGTVFGRVNLIDELGGSGGTVNGADVENLLYDDFQETWTLIAPSGVETIVLSGDGFIGYYTGGSQTYEIFDRSVPNELLIRTTDGNNEFDWWFIITSAEAGSGNEFQSQFTDLIWEDDFETAGAPDSNNWTYDLGDGGWGNGEDQTYTNDSSNVIVEDGMLKINAIKDAQGNYTSARLKSENLFEFTYGRVEVRAKLPASQGTWPAIWMLGANFDTVGWPTCGEIDIMEQKGQDKNTVLATVHHPAVSPGAGDSASTSLPTSTTEFHNYTVEWTDSKLTFLVDDFVYHEVNNDLTLPFNADFFLILNIAMGGTLGGDIDPNFNQDSMEIEYVRVYQ
jgi:hypothetical protein